MSSIAENNKRIAKNTLILTLRMLVTMGISIYSSRIILQALGVIDYGIYNVVGSIIMMLSFFNSSLITSTQRHITYYIGKRNTNKISDIVRCSIHLHIFLAILITIIAETIGLYFLNYNLNIPNDRIYAANIIYQLTIISTVFGIISIPYKALIISYEHLNIYAYIAIIQSIITLIISLIVLYTNIDKLILYTFLLTLLNIGIRTYEKWYCKHKEFYNSQLYNKESYKEILSFSGWNTLVSFAHFAYTQGSTFLLNIFCGPISNAAQALATQVNLTLMTFNSNFTLAIKPQIIKSYAEENKEYFNLLIKYNLKLSFLIMGIIAIPFIIRTNYIISLWLTDIPLHTNEFLKLALILSMITSFTDPISTAIFASGNIKRYQLAEFIALISILPLSYIVLKNDAIAYNIYYIRICVFTLFLFVRLYYLQNQLHINFRQSIYIILKIIISTLISTLLLFYINQFIPYNFIGFIILCIFSLLINVCLAYYIAFNSNERKTIIKFIQNTIKKYIIK